MRPFIPLVLACALVSACSSDDNNPATAPLEGNETEGTENAGNGAENEGNESASVRYRVTFESVWAEAPFPTQFPGGNAHFSGLVGAVHNEQVIFWQRGQPASAGMKNMAETGGKSPLTDEVQAQIDAGTTLSLLSGSNLPSTPGDVSLEFELNRDYPQVTLVSMVAPSPDWFVGVHNLSLLNEQDEFVAELRQPLVVYDAGTDSGLRFTSANEASNGEVITRLSCQAADCDFLEGVHRDGNADPSHIGSFVFERIESP